ncbi:MAG: OmpH family outer membrane protein [Bacteroidales bacterium]|nr:OmpH family outer membrane protein [Bacteroidales bacterium]
MKKVLVSLCALLLVGVMNTNAQKVAVIDMEYILKAVPAYETANEQLSQLSKKWQKEVEALLTEVQNMYKAYQTEQVFLSAEMKTQREEAILNKERQANDLKRKYFGADGDLFKKRESLMKPIQDEIYNALQEYCNEKGYQIILDKASTVGLIFVAPKIDVSDEVLVKLGYAK